MAKTDIGKTPGKGERKVRLAQLKKQLGAIKDKESAQYKSVEEELKALKESYTKLEKEELRVKNRIHQRRVVDLSNLQRKLENELGKVQQENPSMAELLEEQKSKADAERKGEIASLKKALENIDDKDPLQRKKISSQMEALEKVDKLLQPFDKEIKRINELQEILYQEKAPEVLEKHFEDRTIAKESAFKQDKAKPSGVADGYVAKRNSDDHLFMMKKAMKEEMVPEIKTPLGEEKIRSKDFDSMNLVNEFVTGGIFRDPRVLGNRAPIIELVESSTPGLINLRSKFLPDFQTVSEFTGANPPGIGLQADKLKDVKGAEKYFAAALFGGEYDIHAGNVGVIKAKDDQGKDIMVFAKIDHGWSASQFFSDHKKMLKNLANALKVYHYTDIGKLNLKLDKFKEAVDEITKISDQEIETMIKSRVYQLKKAGMDIKDLEF